VDTRAEDPVVQVEDPVVPAVTLAAVDRADQVEMVQVVTPVEVGRVVIPAEDPRASCQASPEVDWHRSLYQAMEAPRMDPILVTDSILVEVVVPMMGREGMTVTVGLPTVAEKVQDSMGALDQLTVEKNATA